MSKQIPKTCFIVSSIGVESSQTRKTADEKLNFVFEPVLDSKYPNSHGN